MHAPYAQQILDRRLRHVVAVARSGSFTSAARIAGVTQSAVTKNIADLEKSIGFAIFHRTSRGVVLTDRGRDFVERAERLLDDARQLLNLLDTPADIFAGYLRIGVCPASIEWLITRPLAQLLALHPSIRFEIIGSNVDSMIQRVRNGGVDVAVGYDAAFRDRADLKLEDIGELDTPLFVRNGHPLLQVAAPTIRDLAPFDFVSSSDSRPYGEAVRSIYESQGIEWQRRLHIIDYFPTVRHIVATSDAIGFVSRSYARSDRFKSQFSLLPGPMPVPPLGLSCVTRARWEPTPATRAFIALMREHLAPQAPERSF